MPTTADQNLQPIEQHFVLVQFGVMSIIGKIPVGDGRALKRGEWVVCQTGRGLEMGNVCSFGCDTSDHAADYPSSVLSGQQVDGGELNHDSGYAGHFVRQATDGDHMAASRLASNKDKGLEVCSEWLAINYPDQILLDVDVTLDGKRLYFHFLGSDDEFNPVLNEQLVELYDQATGIRKFTEAVATGCGPDCGSDGSGCGTSGTCGTKSGGCGTCGLKNHCPTKA